MYLYSTPVNVIIIVGSIPTLPPLLKKFARSRYSRNGGGGNRWPAQKRYTHPPDDGIIDIYLLGERNTSTVVTARGKGEGLEEHAIDEGKAAGFPDHGEMQRKSIRKTTDLDVKYQSR